MKMQVETGDLTFEQMKGVSLQDLFIQTVHTNWPVELRLSQATTLAEGQRQFDHANRDRRGGHQPRPLSDRSGVLGFTAKERKYVKRVGVRQLRRDAKAEAQRQVREMHAVERETLSWYEQYRREAEAADYDDYVNGRGVYDDDSYDYPDDFDDDPWDDELDTQDDDDYLHWHQQADEPPIRRIVKCTPKNLLECDPSLEDRVITSADRGMTLGELLREYLENQA